MSVAIAILVVGVLIATIQRQGTTYIRLAFSGSDSELFDSPSAVSAYNLLYSDTSDETEQYKLTRLSDGYPSAEISTGVDQTTASDTYSYLFGHNPLYFPKVRSDSTYSERKTHPDRFAEPAATSAPHMPQAARARPTLKQAGCARCSDEIAVQRYTHRTAPLFAAVMRNLFRKRGSTHLQPVIATNGRQKESPLLFASIFPRP